MRRIKLGVNGPEISCIGLGTMGLGGRYGPDSSADDISTDILQRAVDGGINFFDTAEVYADGHAEELLGRVALKRRKDIVIATKFAPSNSAYDRLIAAAENSLRRLGTDYIDLYQNHWPNPQVPLEETLQALSKLVSDGKVRHIGLSNVTSIEIAEISNALPEDFPLVSVQQEYNLEERFVEARILPSCRQTGLVLVAYSPLGQGKLAENKAEGLMQQLVQKYRLTEAQICLQWAGRQNGVLPIPMTSKISHLEDNLLAFEQDIAPEDLDALSAAYAPDIRDLDFDQIEVVASHTGKAFHTLEDARRNTLQVSPSPIELSEELKSGEMLKPVKVRLKPGEQDYYELYEGQLRYWAWTIAHDGKRPIQAQVTQ